VTEVLQNLDKYILNDGGIQVIDPKLSKAAIDGIGKTTLSVEGPEDGPIIRGTATANLMGLNVGGGWAADYLAEGYAIMGDRTSVGHGLTGRVMMAKAPGYIADNASHPGGNYVVIDAPAQLMLEAQKLAQGLPPGIPDPGGLPPENGQSEVKTAGETPSWIVPAVVGVGLLTAAALVVSAGNK